MANNKDRILCDYKCPLHDKCRNYVEGFDKTKTMHWGKDPFNYQKGKCSGFEPFSEDDLIDRINNILIKPLNN
jgi:hypothetical protein